MTIPSLDENFYSNNPVNDEQKSGTTPSNNNPIKDEQKGGTSPPDSWVDHILSYSMIFLPVLLLLLEHKIPINKAPQFNVESASIYSIQFNPVSNPLNISIEYRLTAGWNISFSVANPSKQHVLSYSNIAATVCYKETPLWVTMIPGFHQPEKSRDIVYATFAAEPVTIDLRSAVSILDDINSGSSSAFSVILSGNLQRKKCQKDGESSWRKMIQKDETSPLVASCELNVVFSHQKSGLQGSVAGLVEAGN